MPLARFLHQHVSAAEFNIVGMRAHRQDIHLRPSPTASFTNVRTHTPVGPFGIRLGVVEPRGARDIEMDPRRVLGEFAQEPRRADGAAPAPPDVRQIREGALQQLLVIVVHRHVPHLFTFAFRGRHHAAEQGVVVGEHAGIDVSQRNHDSASQRRGVHQVRAAEAAGIGDRVGQNQAAFRVRVEHFDGLAG